jgi:hypothetical protein
LLAASVFCLVNAAQGAEPLVRFTDEAPALEVRALSAPLTVRVRYGAPLDPAAFRATLNGADVTAAFTPEAGAEELVTLPFVPGRNLLELEAWSRAVGGAEPVREYVDREITFARLPVDTAADDRLKSLPELRHERWKETTPEADADADAEAPPPDETRK